MTPSKLQDEIMRKIREKKITMKSRYRFLAEAIGIKSLVVFSILLVVIFISIALHILQEEQAFVFLAFGSSGLLAFLEAFPFLWITAACAVFVSLGYFLKRFHLVYRYPFENVVVILLGGVILFATIAAFSGMTKTAETILATSSPELFCSLFPPRQRFSEHILEGTIASLSDNSLELVDPLEKKINVMFERDCMLPRHRKLEIGSKVFIGGMWENTEEKVFLAQYVRIADDEPGFLRHFEKRGRRLQHLSTVCRTPPPPPFPEKHEIKNKSTANF